jgi:hypothetical protein
VSFLLRSTLLRALARARTGMHYIAIFVLIIIMCKTALSFMIWMNNSEIFHDSKPTATSFGILHLAA